MGTNSISDTRTGCGDPAPGGPGPPGPVAELGHSLGPTVPRSWDHPMHQSVCTAGASCPTSCLWSQVTQCPVSLASAMRALRPLPHTFHLCEAARPSGPRHTAHTLPLFLVIPGSASPAPAGMGGRSANPEQCCQPEAAAKGQAKRHPKCPTTH